MKKLAMKRKKNTKDNNLNHCHVCELGGNLYCCDQCPRSFHAKCLLPSNVPPSSGASWTCPKCSEIPDFSFLKNKNKTQIKQALLEALVKHEFSEPFLAPLTSDKYRLAISKPMDLKTVSANVKQDIYPTMDAFAQDVKLIFENCRTYNDVHSTIARTATIMSDTFEAMLQSLTAEKTTTSTMPKRKKNKMETRILLPVKKDDSQRTCLVCFQVTDMNHADILTFDRCQEVNSTLTPRSIPQTNDYYLLCVDCSKQFRSSKKTNRSILLKIQRRLGRKKAAASLKPPQAWSSVQKKTRSSRVTVAKENAMSSSSSSLITSSSLSPPPPMMLPLQDASGVDELLPSSEMQLAEEATALLLKQTARADKMVILLQTYELETVQMEPLLHKYQSLEKSLNQRASDAGFDGLTIDSHHAQLEETLVLKKTEQVTLEKNYNALNVELQGMKTSRVTLRLQSLKDMKEQLVQLETCIESITAFFLDAKEPLELLNLQVARVKDHLVAQPTEEELTLRTLQTQRETDLKKVIAAFQSSQLEVKHIEQEVVVCSHFCRERKALAQRLTHVSEMRRLCQEDIVLAMTSFSDLDPLCKDTLTSDKAFGLADAEKLSCQLADQLTQATATQYRLKQQQQKKPLDGLERRHSLTEEQRVEVDAGRLALPTPIVIEDDDSTDSETN